MLDGAPLFLKLLVIRVLAQARQQIEVIGPGVCAQRLCDQRCQPRVAPGQPPPRRDAVRLVLELVGRQLIEVLQVRSASWTFLILESVPCTCGVPSGKVSVLLVVQPAAYFVYL